MLALFARRPCHSRLLSLRYLASEAVSTTTAETSSPAPADEASTSAQLKPATGTHKTVSYVGQLRVSLKVSALCPAGLVREPAWWRDTTVDATRAYRIIMNRFRVHGSQSENHYAVVVSLRF